MKPAIALFLMALLLPLGSSSAAVSDREIAQLYERGLRGDKAAVEQCIEKLEAVLKTDARNQLARVYLGSAYTLRSRDMGFGPKKLNVLKQGVAVMDEAVAAAPDDSKVRLARALTTSALPGILGYADDARKDFAQLAEIAGRSPGKFDRGDLQIIFYNAGVAADKRRDRPRAAELFRAAARHPIDRSLTKKVDAELANGP
jgi:hypothetical protein